MNDTISRQQTIAALRALSDDDGYINAPHEVVTDVVRGLPPVRAKQGQTVHSEQPKKDKFGVKTSETCEDCISRQAAIDAMNTRLEDVKLTWRGRVKKGEIAMYLDMRGVIETLPSVQPEPLSDAYIKAVWTWLLDYQIKAAELKGRYTPYEVLSWVANDWRKEHER